MTRYDKREYLKCVKRMVKTEPDWLLKCYLMPTKKATAWSQKVTGAVLKRAGVLKEAP